MSDDVKAAKAAIVSRLGPDAREKYLEALSCFLSFDIHKVEFERRVFKALSPAEIALHNGATLSFLPCCATPKNGPWARLTILP